VLYSSERNYGCRFLEISIFGYRAVILENEKIRITFLLDKGTEIIEFNQKETDTDFIWRSPQGLSCLEKIKFAKKDEQILTDGYTGGWFECFPNVGEACTYKGAKIPHYGEICYLPWEYTVLKDDPGEVSLKCFVHTTKTPFVVEKILTVKSGIASLYIEEKITNIGREDMAFQWGHHPNFGAPFIDGNCIIDMPKAEGVVGYSGPESRFIPGTKGIWPYFRDKNGNEINAGLVQGHFSGVCEEIDLFDVKEGRIGIRNQKKKIGVELLWDLQAFRHITVWNIANGDTGYPRYGNTYVLGFFVKSDDTRGLEKSSHNGKCLVIRKGETKKAWFSASAVHFLS
jgi:hypothetical protein